MSGTVETFQLSVEAAEVYESQFVPALFAEWAPHLVTAAGVAPGQAVLDVACGTGVVARAAADRMGGQGRVVGLDLNQGMLTVAGRLRPDIEWRQGDAASLPFAPGSFDVVLCQSALMFFPDRAGALREMARVATPGGTVAVQVWDQLEAQEGYAAMYAAFARHVGPEAGRLEGAIWALGDLELVGSRCSRPPACGSPPPGPGPARPGFPAPRPRSPPSSRPPPWPGGSTSRPTSAPSRPASRPWPRSWSTAAGSSSRSGATSSPRPR